jgi:uncharacterized protein involved in exopolysaccharide biosynthesis
MNPDSSQGNSPGSQGPEPTEKPFPWAEVLSAVWAHRTWIIIFVAATTIIAAGISLLIPPLYTAQTSILPELTKEKTLGLAGLSSLAEATGLNLGEAPVSKLYPMIVKSERILRAAIYHKYSTLAYPQPVNLVEYWKISAKNENEEFDRALKILRGRMDIVFDARLGTVTITVEMEEPQLAADVANEVTLEMDDYTRTKRNTNATLQREFIEKRMQEVQQGLEQSEQTLKDFRERNRRVSDSPELMMQQERLERDVQINSTVFIELKKQFEIAKIEEIKNIPIINVLDSARAPVGKSYPRRRATVLVVLVLSLVVGVGFAGFASQGKRALGVLKAGIKGNPPTPGSGTTGEQSTASGGGQETGHGRK